MEIANAHEATTLIDPARPPPSGRRPRIAPPPMLSPGDVLAGKYRIEGLLGEGGMGSVFKALHLGLEEWVAIKVLRRELRGDARAVERFLREARNAAKIRSEHAIRVIDVDRLTPDLPYIVTEHLEGKDLARLLDDEGPLPPATAVEFVLQACSAIADAHALGIVHRDLKPSNLFYTQRWSGSPCIKVLDFGLCKRVCGDRVDVAITDGTVGTPMYMSPEQLTCAPDIDGATDVWSLGVVLFRLLTREYPFRDGSDLEVAANIVTAPPRSLCALCSAPQELEAIVHACLERERARRWSVRDLARALVRVRPRLVGWPPSASRARHFALRSLGAISMALLVVVSAGCASSPVVDDGRSTQEDIPAEVGVNPAPEESPTNPPGDPTPQSVLPRCERELTDCGNGPDGKPVCCAAKSDCQTKPDGSAYCKSTGGGCGPMTTPCAGRCCPATTICDATTGACQRPSKGEKTCVRNPTK